MNDVGHCLKQLGVWGALEAPQQVQGRALAGNQGAAPPGSSRNLLISKALEWLEILQILFAFSNRKTERTEGINLHPLDISARTENESLQGTLE